jgi:hypothetical protein
MKYSHRVCVQMRISLLFGNHHTKRISCICMCVWSLVQILRWCVNRNEEIWYSTCVCNDPNAKRFRICWQCFCTFVGTVVKIIIGTFLQICTKTGLCDFYDYFCANSMLIMFCFCGYCCHRAFSAFVITFMQITFLCLCHYSVQITFCAFVVILCI